MKFGALPVTELGTLGCRGGARDVTGPVEGAGAEPDKGLINGAGIGSIEADNVEGIPT